MPSRLASQFAPPVALYLQFFFESHPRARKGLNVLLKHLRKHTGKYSPDFVLSYLLSYSFKYSVAYFVKFFLGSMYKRMLRWPPRKLLKPPPEPKTKNPAEDEGGIAEVDWEFHDT